MNSTKKKTIICGEIISESENKQVRCGEIPPCSIHTKKKTKEVTDYLDFTYQTMPAGDRLKLDVGNIYENKIECKKCHWIIRSKNRHNYVTCKCGNVAVDGGSWYQRIMGDEYIDHTTYFKYKHK